MLKVGLTGGIASGKSTVSRLFHERHDVPVIDADVVSREVVTPGKPALARIVQRFGAQLLDGNGELNRQQLRDRVFADRQSRLDLEAILHPVIQQEMLEQIRKLQAPYCILAIPLLMEAGQQDMVDRILVVDSPEDLQLQRLVQRDKTTPAMAREILSAQIDRHSRLSAADDVITNNGTIEDLVDQVDQLHALYIQLSASV